MLILLVSLRRATPQQSQGPALRTFCRTDAGWELPPLQR